MNRWYRQSLPGRGLFVVFLTLVLLSDLPGIGVWWAWGRVLDPVEAWIHTLPFLVIGPVLCVVASMCVAAARVMRFPARRSDYFEWLATTPWQSSRRTPFGPWYPVVQDIIPVGAVTGLFALHIGALQHLNASADGILAELGWTPNMFRLALLLPVVAFWVAWTLCSFLAVCSDWKWSVYVPFLCISLLWHLALRVPVEASFIAVLLSFAAGTFAVCRRMLTVLKSLPSPASHCERRSGADSKVVARGRIPATTTRGDVFSSIDLQSSGDVVSGWTVCVRLVIPVSVATTSALLSATGRSDPGMH